MTTVDVRTLIPRERHLQWNWRVQVGGTGA